MKDNRLHQPYRLPEPSHERGRVFTGAPRQGVGPWLNRFTCIVVFAQLMLLLGAPHYCKAAGALKKSPAQLVFERAANLSLHRRTREVIARSILSQPEQALDLLVRNTRSTRSILRQVACILLGELGDERAEPALIKVGVSPDFIAGAHARKALAKIYSGLNPAEVVKRITTASGTGAAKILVQRAALDAVFIVYSRDDAPAMPPRMEKACAGCLDSDVATLRAGAVLALGLSGNPRNGARLTALAKTEADPTVIINLCRALARMRPLAGGDSLRSWLKHKDKAVQLETAYALYAMGDNSALPIIANFLGEDSLDLRLRATTILGDLRDPATLEALGRATADISWRVRLEAVNGLAKLKSPGITGVLRRLVGDDDARVRAVAAKLLHKLGVSGAAWSLIDDLGSGRTDRRIEAARALGEIHEARAITPLETVLHSQDLELACTAAEALAAIGSKRAGRELVAALADKRPALQYWSRLGLKRIFGSDPGEDPAGWPGWAKANKIR